MFKNGKLSKFAPAIIGLLLLSALSFYNIKNNVNFWEASFTTCITIAIAILLSYTLVQQRSDERRRKEIIEEVMISLQRAVSDPAAYIINDSANTAAINMRKRDISNKIETIKKYIEKLRLELCIESIEEWFREYEALIGDHINSLDYLCQSQNELKRPLLLIESELYNIRLELYK